MPPYFDYTGTSQRSVWCEVQVEYGLLGKRYLKPSQRPSSFLSSSGVEIKVNSNLVISRQSILDGGIKVHSKLEKEVAPEKVKVQVITTVDTWALKVMNTMVSLSLLRSTGMMREIPVWGFIGGFFIQGIVDQIDMIPGCDSSSTNDTSARESPDRTTPSAPDEEAFKGFSVRISDSKTTQGENLPPPEYTESARYQLMLYKYLFDQHASGLFDLEKFATHFGLDLDEPFSRTFMADAMPVLESIETSGICLSGPSVPKTLRQIFALYQRVVNQIGASQTTLEIVYRKRGKARSNLSAGGNASKKIKADHDEKQNSVPKAGVTVLTSVVTFIDNPLVDPQLLDNKLEPVPIEQVINPALKTALNTPAPPDSLSNSPIKAPITQSTTSPGGSGGPETPVTASAPGEADDSLTLGSGSDRTPSTFEGLEEDEEEALFAGLAPASSSFASLTPIVQNSPTHNIIGAYQFLFHPAEFSRFILRTIRFWNGDISPVGVDIQNSNKCSPCEFKESCEWRAKLSNQILDSIC